MQISKKQVTRQELDLAGDLSLTDKQLQFLLAKTPAKYTRTRKGKGGKSFTYVSGGYVTKVLNLMFGFRWNFRILDQGYDIEVGQCWVRGQLTVPTPEGPVIKEQYGSQEIALERATGKPVSIGDSLKGAATDALKKCASLLGVAADIYAAEEFTEVEVVAEKEPDNLRQLRTYLSRAEDQEQVGFVLDQYLENYPDTPDARDLVNKRLAELEKQ